MEQNVKKLWDFYNFKPGAAIVQEEFGFFVLDNWIKQGYIKEGENISELFGYDTEARASLGGLGWCEAEFYPMFTEEVLEDRGKHELVRDHAGRSVLYFKNRRHGFMPEYVDHPVKDIKTWEEDVKWRLDPKIPERYIELERRMPLIRQQQEKGYVVVQRIIGGYMYLRSLIGPADLLYMFYDNGGLIHKCMEAWLTLADSVCAFHQQFVSFDEVFFGEDICYNGGCLISPEMMKEFLIPYYQQLIKNIKARQSNKKLHIQIDTDGNALPVIDIYKNGIDMDYMSPFEVASGCDVVKVRGKYPDLLIRGGIDKRILAQDKTAIDREIDRIMPYMVKKGGYIPCCDHGVPEEVSFENYMHYRNRMKEF